MSDLVSRLRDCAAWDPGDGEDEGFALLREAADEIEALRGLADWVRQYELEREAPHGAKDLMLLASVRQSMFDALAALEERP